METYNQAAERTSRVVTEAFSSSFSSAISLLDATIRQDIYNIYGLVRLADEIVDSYQGIDAEGLLNQLEKETYSAIEGTFSTNLVVYSFCRTAIKYDIGKDLITPFFNSMRMDVTLKSMDEKQYDTYIYGSAEVVGLMCLKIFTDGDPSEYAKLKDAACVLGAAYQKINFLRDIKDDYETRGRFYFPNTTYAYFDEKAKKEVIADIQADLDIAKGAIDDLPKQARVATKLSYDYYTALLEKLEKMSVDTLKQERASLNKLHKLHYLLRAMVGQYGW